MATQAANSELLFSGSDWDFTKLSRVYDAIEAIAVEELHLDIYPVQMEIISSQ
ncbi:SpoVR family protein, partial [Mesorhizobium sp. M2D.F.Ca.ET.145.01.1.1]